MIAHETNDLLDGMRFRRKRKFRELDVVTTSSDLNKENLAMNDNNSKKMKHPKSKPKAVPKLPLSSKEKCKVLLVISVIEEEMNRSLSFHSLNESKPILKAQYDIRSKNFDTMQEKYRKERVPKILSKTANFCNKNIKNLNKMKVKLANLFADEKIGVEEKNYNFPLINIELLFIDLLHTKNILYEALLDADVPNIANLLLYFFSQSCKVKVLRGLLSSLDNSIDKVKR